ncbi:MAG TPA: shikimate dehydrogenase [Acidimicrobiales bacterium]|nr:shikimate dehydrogenase [Acidimicrobiales bacterium]
MTDEAIRFMPITGATEFAGVIGDPVAHSLSPRLHNRAYAALGVDMRYGTFCVPVGQLQAAILGARALGFRGLSVTTPHKDEAARYADQRSDDVELLGAANTIVFLSSVVVAESTDGQGLIDDLAINRGFSANGERCVVLGAGGAARAIVLALARAGAGEVIVVNRSERRGNEATAVAPGVARLGTHDDIAGATLVVNATSLALQQGTEESARGDARRLADTLHHGQIAVDISYKPTKPVFLEIAEERGATVRNGLGMLVHQAAAQVQLFTGFEAPIDEMWSELSEFERS